MRATLVLFVAAALFAAALPFAHRADAREGELATPSLREGAEDGARLMVWEGASALTVQGACLAPLRLCLGQNESTDGRFFLPWSGADGRVVVAWTPANDSLRELRVSVGGVTLAGASPIVFEFLGGVAGEYAVHAEPNATVAGSWQQPIAWVASFVVGRAPEELQLAGTAGYTTTVGCALVLCDTTLRQQSDPLLAPWTARGTIVVEWDPIEGPLRVSIPGTSLAAEGETPLTLAFDELPAGEWRLDVREDLAGPASSVEARWRADLVEKASS